MCGDDSDKISRDEMRTVGTTTNHSKFRSVCFDRGSHLHVTLENKTLVHLHCLHARANSSHSNINYLRTVQSEVVGASLNFLRCIEIAEIVVVGSYDDHS